MKRNIVIVLVLLLIAAAYFIGKPIYHYHFGKINDLDKDELIVYIPSDATVSSIADLLKDNQVISKDEFMDYATYFEFDDSKVEGGKYRIEKGMKIKNLVYGLKNGNQEIKDVQITFNNCRDIYQMAGKVAPKIEADSTEIVNYLEDQETLLKYGFTEATIPALFLPDTYEVGEWDMTAEGFVRYMADRYKEFWNEERMAKAVQLDLTQSDVATIASIIEAEQSIVKQEWKTIAGLYLNRVKNNWKLESDPTFKFCWGDSLKGVQRLLEKHREIDCPYNTYIYRGLPPGPIRIPSKNAIDAVLNAEQHDYFFMCAKPDNSGLHNFAKTLSEHNRNARLWWNYANERGY